MISLAPHCPSSTPHLARFRLALSGSHAYALLVRSRVGFAVEVTGLGAAPIHAGKPPPLLRPARRRALEEANLVRVRINPYVGFNHGREAQIPEPLVRAVAQPMRILASAGNRSEVT